MSVNLFPWLALPTIILFWIFWFAHESSIHTGKIGITAISADRAHENHAFFHFLGIFGINPILFLNDIKILLSFHFTRAINKAFCWFTVPSSLYYWLTADKTSNSSAARTCYSCKQGSQPPYSSYDPLSTTIIGITGSQALARFLTAPLFACIGKNWALPFR